MATEITREVLEGYLECRDKGRLRLAGEAGEPSDYGRMTTEDRQEVRARGLEDLLSRAPDGLACGGEVLTTAILRRGASVITEATLAGERLIVRYDGLVKAPGPSFLGDFHHLPVLCCEGAVVRQQQRHLLAVLGHILGVVQGRQPAIGVAIHGPAGTRSNLVATRDAPGESFPSPVIPHRRCQARRPRSVGSYGVSAQLSSAQLSEAR